MTNGASLATLGEGSRAVDFRATDAAGNVGAASAAHTFTVDTVFPVTTIDCC